MKVAAFHEITVDKDKLVSYLLNSSHPDNGGKAMFFAALGFSGQNWGEFAAALRDLVLTSENVSRLDSPHCTKYVVDGVILGSAGTSGHIRSVWIVNAGQDTIRLVTAYPWRVNNDGHVQIYV